MNMTFRQLGFIELLNTVKEYISSDGAKKEFLEKSISQDLSIEDINNRFEFLTELMELFTYGDLLPPSYREITEELAQMKHGYFLEIETLISIADNLELAGDFRKSGERLEGFAKVAEFFKEFIEKKELLETINSRIDLKKRQLRPDASPLLRKLSRELGSIERRIQDRLTKLIGKYKDDDVIQDDVPLYRDGRYLLGVKAGKNNIIEGIVHGRSTSKNTFFIEPGAIVSINNEKRELEFRIDEEIRRILIDLTEKVVREFDDIQLNQDRFVQYDIFYGVVKFSVKYKCNPVEVTESTDKFIIKEGIHPLLNIDPIPITFEFEKGKKIAIISGPNAAGKTVSLKMLGLAVLMVKKGLFPPVHKNSVIPYFTKVYSAIGDEQSIEKNLSSFTSHIVRLKEILETGDDKTLILLDEIGEGTDPGQGEALARSIIEEFIKSGSTAVLTTHYHYLKTLAYDFDEIENYSVSFDVATMTPKFKIIKGIPGKSYAFLIAKKVGLPEQIIDRAATFLDSSQLKSEVLFSKMEDHCNILENELELANVSRIKIETKLAKKDKELERVRKELFEKKNILIKNFREYLNGIKDEIKQQLKSVRKNSESDLSRIQNKVNQIDRDIEKKIEKKPAYIRKKKIHDEDIVCGVEVSCSNGITGKIIDITGNKVKIDSEGMTWTVKKDELDYVVKALKTKKKEPSILTNYSVPQVKSEISLIGMNVDEAIDALSGYLSSAMLSKYNLIYIIHGKGSGILRQAVNEYLCDVKDIKSFRLGGVGEGGTGVTVIEL